MYRFLIADDNARMRDTVREVLSNLASEIHEARDGAEAMAVYAMHRPDWVVMDIHMQPMNGLQATAALKAQFPNARILIISSHSESELKAEAIRAGACAYLLKEDLHLLETVLAEYAPQGID